MQDAPPSRFGAMPAFLLNKLIAKYVPSAGRTIGVGSPTELFLVPTLWSAVSVPTGAVLALTLWMTIFKAADSRLLLIEAPSGLELVPTSGLSHLVEIGLVLGSGSLALTTCSPLVSL